MASITYFQTTDFNSSWPKVFYFNSKAVSGNIFRSTKANNQVKTVWDSWKSKKQMGKNLALPKTFSDPKQISG